MKTIYVIVALALISTSAQAWEERTTCTYSKFFGTTCRTVGIEDPMPQRDPAQEAEDLKVKQEGIRKWEAYCRPTRTHDELGVVRLVYARTGCEFGRNE